jgi:hypothetical protein
MLSVLKIHVGWLRTTNQECRTRIEIAPAFQMRDRDVSALREFGCSACESQRYHVCTFSTDDRRWGPEALAFLMVQESVTLVKFFRFGASPTGSINSIVDWSKWKIKHISELMSEACISFKSQPLSSSGTVSSYGILGHLSTGLSVEKANVPGDLNASLAKFCIKTNGRWACSNIFLLAPARSPRAAAWVGLSLLTSVASFI